MTNDECPMNDEARMTKGEKRPLANGQFDLEERTARFGESVVRFAKKNRMTTISEPLLNQLVRSATSIGANYCEADDSGSKKEFKYRIGICKREARETKHWLRMLAAAIDESADLTKEARAHWQEAKELHLIFASIFRSLGKRG
jgi:four helix bundle protein